MNDKPMNELPMEYDLENFSDALAAGIVPVKDYKAPHANRGTPARRHYPRKRQGNKPLFRV